MILEQSAKTKNSLNYVFNSAVPSTFASPTKQTAPQNRTIYRITSPKGKHALEPVRFVIIASAMPTVIVTASPNAELFFPSISNDRSVCADFGCREAVLLYFNE